MLLILRVRGTIGLARVSKILLTDVLDMTLMLPCRGENGSRRSLDVLLVARILFSLARGSCIEVVVFMVRVD